MPSPTRLYLSTCYSVSTCCCASGQAQGRLCAYRARPSLVAVSSPWPLDVLHCLHSALMCLGAPVLLRSRPTPWPGLVLACAHTGKSIVCFAAPGQACSWLAVTGLPCIAYASQPAPGDCGAVVQRPRLRVVQHASMSVLPPAQAASVRVECTCFSRRTGVRVCFLVW